MKAETEPSLAPITDRDAPVSRRTSSAAAQPASLRVATARVPAVPPTPPQGSSRLVAAVRQAVPAAQAYGPAPAPVLSWARAFLGLSEKEASLLFASWGGRACLRVLPDGSSPVPRLLKAVDRPKDPSDHSKGMRRSFSFDLTGTPEIAVLPAGLLLYVPSWRDTRGNDSRFRVALSAAGTMIEEIPTGFEASGFADFRGCDFLHHVADGVTLHQGADFRGCGLLMPASERQGRSAFAQSVVVKGSCDLRGTRVPPFELPAGVPDALFGPDADAA